MSGKGRSEKRHSESGRVETPAHSAQTITDSLLEHVGGIAKSCGATAVFVYVDALEGKPLSLTDNLQPKLYYVTKTTEEESVQQDQKAQYLKVPNVPLTRLGQVKIAVFLALSRGLIKQGDKIVFLSGIAASGNLDTIIVTEVGREYEMFAALEADRTKPPHVLPEVVDRVIELASELGKEGREGKPVGALFVVGDTDKVLSLTSQLILNPFRGYAESERNILDESLAETVKELSSLDGAFVIRSDGVVETCGAFLKTASQDEYELPMGLGARHHAAAGITSVTDSIAVTVSESTGTVTVFRAGRVITEIERPRPVGPKSIYAVISEQKRLHE